MKWNANNDDDNGCILVHATPSPTKAQYLVDEIPSPITVLICETLSHSQLMMMPPYTKANRQELRRIHSCPESRYNSASPPNALDYDLDEEDAEQARVNASRTKVDMNGWRDRWAVTSKTKKTIHAQHVPAEEGSTPHKAVPPTLLNPKNQEACVSSTSKHPRSAPSRIVGGGKWNEADQKG
ncbi:hypothetical protein BYT27DRAFT_7255059 [Phlegmacium glaucopus]|nr:hypothetical protein BYT27DRAFT_7255059 [Phlegmacium glaucopus]